MRARCITSLLFLFAVTGCVIGYTAAATAAPVYPITKPVVPVSKLEKAMCHQRAPKRFRHIKGGPWKQAIASTFYIGEEADTSNANISNISTAWDDYAVHDFGDVDQWGPINPKKWAGPWYPRNGWCPEGFLPKQQPFYLALQTLDHDDNGRLKAAEKQIRIGAHFLQELRRFKHGRFTENQAPFKNLWVEIVFRGRAAFAQLEDVGPSDKHGRSVSDYHYVWGKARKCKNNFGVKACTDLSPATTDYLGTHGDDKVRWRFVPKSQVPRGPWTVRPDTRGPHWKQ
jgi:hypothetical protein